jgi:beta-glucosidase
MPKKAERLQYDGKAREAVSKMTLDEKIWLMSGRISVWTLAFQTSGTGSKGYHIKPFPAGGCELLGVPELRFCDGPRGVLPGRSTCFPVTMTRAPIPS